MSSIDQQFVEFVVKSLVNEPDAVKVERSMDERGVLLELTVAPDDLGRVIGRRGTTAQSLRTLLRALGTKNSARYNLKIVDDGMRGGADMPSDDSGPDQGQDEDIPAPAEPTDEEPEDDQEEEASTKGKKDLAEYDDLDI